ncbi:cob(I)yrinic acid a,c-diamide adenosyltransferase [Facilibium subflavum]|uniref:cob(I)yrinic acid a,c-diamide adenosyltransferase n=1 Tax=Facilibium subflavum TaxID=2219058 RepID=UPI001F42BDAC|nr:cob(I)yrinic acid a,c-diamide adenosyltransferase [Facilibium subflavum]
MVYNKHQQKPTIRQNDHMGYRLSKIYTKTGDQGTTALSDNKRLYKDELIIEVIGEIDHLNAYIGVVQSFSHHDEINRYLSNIQQILFNIGGHLSYPEFIALQKEDITTLEHHIDRLNKALPPLKEFILPAGSKASAFCHLARTTARKAERFYVRLMRTKQHNNPLILQYLNRLSDFLFVTARSLNNKDNHNEVLWQSHRIKDSQ